MWTYLVPFVLLFQKSFGDLVVQLPNGKVNGTTIDTPSGSNFFAWRGIPYGKPPIGKLRFLPPVKAEPWDGILDASRDSPSCIQFTSYSGFTNSIDGQSEDCLYVNVYSPVTPESHSSFNSTLPVIFWIYGGAFITGMANFAIYDPSPILEENVIFVSFNYRVGTLGFLSTEDDTILGNAGLKDQLLALKWTRENIAFFGGNPEEITIWGESAGAKSVGFHVVSPLSRGLYKRAIMESGCSISDCLQSDARAFSFALASQLDASITSNSSSEQVRDVLQSADVEFLLNMTKTLPNKVGPIIEIKSNLSFLSGPLYEAVESGDISRVPIVIGHNSEESLFFIPDIVTLNTQMFQHDIDQSRLVPNMPLKENVTAATVGEEVHRVYVDKNASFLENPAGYLEWYSDDRYVRSAHKHAFLHSKFAPVYLYQFSYYGTFSKQNLNVTGAGKVGHAQELGYLFNISVMPVQPEDYLLRRRLIKLWTNFAKTSNPTPDDDSAELLQNVKWEAVTQDNLQHLDIDENLAMKPFESYKKFVFWDYIWDTYSYRPYNTF